MPKSDLHQAPALLVDTLRQFASLVQSERLALAGKNRLSPDALTPNATAKSLREDISAIKEASHG